MRLVSWNLAGRIRRQPEQAEVVLALEPDVVALQEVTVNSLPLWREALAEAGLTHSVTPLDDARPPKPRRLAVLTASRTPLERRDLGPLPWPERAVSVEVEGIEVAERPLADLAVARPREGPHPRGALRLRARATGPDRHRRRPQHPAAHARGRDRPDLRPRHEGPAAGGARRALGRRGARARLHAARRARVGGRVPRRPRAHVDLQGRPRRLAPRPPARQGRRGQRPRLRPRLAAERPERPLRHRRSRGRPRLTRRAVRAR